MKAKKIVRIELKNPTLRRIRKNFRDVIECAVKQEISRLFTKSCEYQKKSRESTFLAKKDRFEQKEDEFRDKSYELDSLLSESIIQCKSGGGCVSYIEATDHGLHPRNNPANLDMAWIPFHEAWFCIKCCGNLIEGDKILRKEKHPDHMRYLREGGFLEEKDGDFSEK